MIILIREPHHCGWKNFTATVPFFRPFRARSRSAIYPRLCAVGFILAPLRGFLWTRYSTSCSRPRLRHSLLRPRLHSGVALRGFGLWLHSSNFRSATQPYLRPCLQTYAEWPVHCGSFSGATISPSRM